MIALKRLNAASADFAEQLNQLLAWEQVSDAGVQARVQTVVDAVRIEGDKALCDYTRQFDAWQAEPESLQIPAQSIQDAYQRIDRAEREALEVAAERIRNYHEHQLQNDWFYEEADGTRLGQKVTALERAGLYVPGGKAAYPSTILMTAIPAKVAGVDELIMVTPTPNGVVNDLVLAAAAIAGIDKVFAIGGAQAVAALAYGTATIPKVDKIVGPGNIYVATAKRMVFGEVAIDMVAGPSEILVLCDGQTDPRWVAMDMLSQAEHDELAQAILVSTDDSYIDAVEKALNDLLPELERADIARASLQNRGALIKTASLEEAVAVINRIAPEHLELSVADPQALLGGIRHAGAIFMGRYTSEALGDYVAGPSHVLPTSTTARFSSPLGVYDFQKRSSIIDCSPEAAARLGKTAALLARGESLTAHARSAEFRVKPDQV